MEFLEITNTERIKTSEIPYCDFEVFERLTRRKLGNGYRPIMYFGVPDKEYIKIYCVLAQDSENKLEILSSSAKSNHVYTSFAADFPCFHLFERELFENFGIMPEGHPWLKMVRYAKNRHNQNLQIKNYEFLQYEGTGSHEVAVGPVHAGVIEPGHFRFLCRGELVDHLEIQLGYQHRGVEQLLLNTNNHAKGLKLIESTVGDSTVAYAWCYAMALESLSGVQISKRAELIRAIGLELERAAMHIGDLSALSGDIAYGLGNSVLGALRTLVINTSLVICGSRFGKSLLALGGVNFDISSSLILDIRNTLSKVKSEVDLMAQKLFSVPSVLSRFESTGTVSHKYAKKIGLVGLAARASGVKIDTRINYPYGLYKDIKINLASLEKGDVYSRAMQRNLEITQSLDFILAQLEVLEQNSESKITTPMLPLEPESFVLSMVEGFRGEIAHAVITNTEGDIAHYKIKDPSFNNWLGLALAVRNNGISDFPLCNKSFNLSYCGHDL